MNKALFAHIAVLLIGPLLGGCIGVHTYQLSGPEPDLTIEELSHSLDETATTIILQDGTMYYGTVIEVRSDSLTLLPDDSEKKVSVAYPALNTVSVSGGEWGIIGFGLGAVIGGYVADGQNRSAGGESMEISTHVGRIVGYAVVGALVGSVALNNIHPPKRYIFGRIPGGRDTLRVKKEDVVSNTNVNVKVMERGKPVTYSKEMIRVVSDGEGLLIIRPAGMRRQTTD